VKWNGRKFKWDEAKVKREVEMRGIEGLTNVVDWSEV
jgi:hypothetical protein